MLRIDSRVDWGSRRAAREPRAAGKSLEDAVYAAEELDETTKLLLLLHGRQTRMLTDAQIEDLRRAFGG